MVNSCPTTDDAEALEWTKCAAPLGDLQTYFVAAEVLWRCLNRRGHSLFSELFKSFSQVDLGGSN